MEIRLGKIKVEPQDITSGDPEDPFECAIAHALHRNGYVDSIVTFTRIEIHENETEHLCSDAMADWQCYLMEGEHVDPNEVVGNEFKNLLKEGKLKQPKGKGKPYVLSGSGRKPPKPPPGESIEEIYQRIRAKLAEDLLQQIKANSSNFFENLVIDLLVKMGYGGSREDAEAVGRSGDGGIDGVINQDRLGLDVVYVQAKRWKNNVGAPDIACFAGALAGKGANRGIFITTSDFTKAAKDYDAAGFKIILIDGKRLAQLMIDHNVGVSTMKIYEIKRVDSDCFIEGIG